MKRPLVSATLAIALAGIILPSAAPGQSAGGEILTTAQFKSAFVGLPGSSRPLPPSGPRLEPLGDAEASPDQRATITRFAVEGVDGNALRTIGHSPEATKEFFPLFAYIEQRSTLPPRDREVLILRVAWLTQNAYLWGRHAPRGQSASLSAREIRAIPRGNRSALHPRDMLLINLADEVFRHSSLSENSYARLVAAFDLRGTMDVVVTITGMIEAALIFNSLGIAPDVGDSARVPRDVKYLVAVTKLEPLPAAPRIEPAPEETRPGRPSLAITRTLARHPALANAWYARVDGISPEPPLAPRDRELLVLRIGWNNRSEYEWAQHVGPVGRAREHGLDPRSIAIGIAAPGWAQRDRTLMAVADELFRDASLSAATWKELEAIYDKRSLIQAIRLTARYHRVSQTLNIIGVKKMPGEEPLPVFEPAQHR